MKIKNIIIILTALIACYACSSKQYIQVYKASPSTDLVKDSTGIIYFENENCKITYNLWATGGNAGFYFYNKSDKNIFINLQECFFVINGIANNYYKNRVYTCDETLLKDENKKSQSPSNLGIDFYNYFSTQNNHQPRYSGQKTITAKYTMSIAEDKVVCIPAKCSKFIYEYNITTNIYKDCDLQLYPSSKHETKKTFDQATSPLVFSNRIAYGVGSLDKPVYISNDFYISEIINESESQAIISLGVEKCNKTYKKKAYKYENPANFFMIYTQQK